MRCHLVNSDVSKVSCASAFMVELSRPGLFRPEDRGVSPLRIIGNSSSVNTA